MKIYPLAYRKRVLHKKKHSKWKMQKKLKIHKLRKIVTTKLFLFTKQITYK